MVDPRLAQLSDEAANNDGCILVTRFHAIGYSEREIRTMRERGFVVRLYRDVYAVAATPDTWRRRVRAASLVVAGRGGAARSTAAALYGLPRCSERSDEVHLVVPYACASKRTFSAADAAGDRLIIHRSRTLTPPDLTTWTGIATTSVERTVAELAPHVAHTQLLDVVAHVLRTRMTTRSALLAYLDVAGNIRGRQRVLDALRELDPGAERTRSKPELHILPFMIEDGLPRPEVNHKVYDDVGRERFEFDLAFVPWRLAVELDSKAHHSDPSAQVHDRSKDNWALLRGWRTMHFTARQVLRTPRWVVRQVGEALELLGWERHPDTPQL